MRLRLSRHRGILTILFLFVLFAGAYSISIPLFEGPDEDDHFRYVKYLADNRAVPVQLFESGGGLAGHQGWQPPLYYGLAALVISPVDTTDLDQHLWRNPAASFQGERSCCGRNLYFHTASEDWPYARTTLAVHLARGVSIAFGALTLALVYLLGLELLSSRWLALTAVSVAAFNPSFLFASALVSNDAPLAAFSTLVLLLLVRILLGRDRTTLRNFAFAGLALGLGLLVKTTIVGLVPFALGAGAFLAWRSRQGRIAWAATSGVLGPAFLLSGWWFIRNQFLYGDPLAYRLMSVSAIFPREQALTFPELFQISLPWLWQTFWGGPTPGDFPSGLLWLLGGMTLMGLAGALFYFRSPRALEARAAFILLAGWLAFIFLAQVQFMRTSGGTDQGRYLFPAMGSLTCLLAVGWKEVIHGVLERLRPGAPLRSSAWLAAISTAGGLILALGVLLVNTVPAFARPPRLDASVLVQAQTVVSANFSNQVALRGASVSTRSPRRGETLRVNLYWAALQPMRTSYRVFVHLVDAKGRVAGGRDVIPGGGAFPTVLWDPGQFVADMVPVTINADALPGLYQLEIGLYPVGEPDNRLNLVKSEEDRVLLDAINIEP